MKAEPCPECGNKPFGGRIKHKAGCSMVTPVTEVKAWPHSHVCCGEPMRRTDGAKYEFTCSHHRLLTLECPECRDRHHGILTYHCYECGRDLRDAPHLAQGDKATRINMNIRTGEG